MKRLRVVRVLIYDGTEEWVKDTLWERFIKVKWYMAGTSNCTIAETILDHHAYEERKEGENVEKLSAC